MSKIDRKGDECPIKIKTSLELSEFARCMDIFVIVAAIRIHVYIQLHLNGGSVFEHLRNLYGSTLFLRPVEFWGKSEVNRTYKFEV